MPVPPPEEYPNPLFLVYLFQFKGIAFIKENYEVEHTLDFGTIVEDLGILCRKNGGAL